MGCEDRMSATGKNVFFLVLDLERGGVCESVRGCGVGRRGRVQ